MARARIADPRQNRRQSQAQRHDRGLAPADTGGRPTARHAHLLDHIRGSIIRRRAGRGFVYLDADGRPVRSKSELERFQSLGIPPAWTDVRIAASARARIQATGRDAKGRKQYRYRPSWRSARDRTKFARMLAFGEALPRIRERLEADLARPGLPREKVLAAAVRLIDATLIRIGNDEYARHNDSYGLTTLRDDHAEISASSVVFCFRGKSGKEHQVRLHDRRLARIVARCRALPGEPLFQYMDETGTIRRIRSEDVNSYLRGIAGDQFSAKDFRTWAGTLCCARVLWDQPRPRSERECKRVLRLAIDEAARQLGNTPTVCRSAYVHPGVIEAYTKGTLQRAPGSRSDEDALLAFLREQTEKADTTVPRAS